MLTKNESRKTKHVLHSITYGSTVYQDFSSIFSSFISTHSHSKQFKHKNHTQPSSMAKHNNNNNIIMFPFMAQGHLIPFLSLSLQLEQKGYKITFINTPLNVANLRRTLPPYSTIRFVEIPFNPTDHNLPPNCENTDTLPPNRIYDLLVASTALQPAFQNILNDLVAAETPPFCVVADFFFGWSAAVSHKFGICHVIFSGSSGFGLACYFSSWINLPHKNSENGEFMLPDFKEAGKLQVTQLTPSLVAATGVDPWSKFQKKNLPEWAEADGFLFNTIEKLDEVGLSYFRRKFGRPVWAVGPINLPVSSGGSPTRKNGMF
ncbi:putative crocetin glucosyltransferase [Helianthus anomalus]